MKKYIAGSALLTIMVMSAPAHGFLDYLFSGSSSRNAVGNSAIGEVRAWWSGNPIYNFNPFYSGSSRPPGQQGAPQANTQYAPGGGQAPPQYGYGAPQQYQQPTTTYYPPGQAQGYAGAAPQQPQMYQQPAQPQAYQAPQPQMYQQPQAYQQPPAYQQPQAYQAPAQQGYGYPQQGAAAPQYQGYPAR